METFKDGQILKSIIWEQGEALQVKDIAQFPDDCVSIIVVMENGQMAGFPWALATFKNGKRIKYNLAKADAVRLEDEK